MPTILDPQQSRIGVASAMNWLLTVFSWAVGSMVRSQTRTVSSLGVFSVWAQTCQIEVRPTAARRTTFKIGLASRGEPSTPSIAMVLRRSRASDLTLSAVMTSSGFASCTPLRIRHLHNQLLIQPSSYSEEISSIVIIYLHKNCLFTPSNELCTRFGSLAEGIDSDAVDETAIKINGEWFWLFAAVHIETTLILDIELFGRYGTDPAAAFLHRLAGKHDLSDAVFLVDGCGYPRAIGSTTSNEISSKNWFSTLK